MADIGSYAAIYGGINTIQQLFCQAIVAVIPVLMHKDYYLNNNSYYYWVLDRKVSENIFNWDTMSIVFQLAINICR